MAKNFHLPAYEASQVVLQKAQVTAFSWPLPICMHLLQGHHTTFFEHPDAYNSMNINGDLPHAAPTIKLLKTKIKYLLK